MKIGSIVKCIQHINPQFDNLKNYGNILPIVGEIYIVRDFAPNVDEVSIRLEEIINPIKKYHYEGGIYYDECSFIQEAFIEFQELEDVNISELFKQEEYA